MQAGSPASGPSVGRGVEAARIVRAWRAARWSPVPVALPPPGKARPAEARARMQAMPARPLLRHDAAARPLVLIGNGPSLQGFDFARFAGHDSFGFNAAYRYWDEIGWYPTYYACLDIVVGLSHRAEIARLIANRQRYGIRRFFLRANLVEALALDAEAAEAVVNFDALRAADRFFETHPITTGSHALLLGAAIGYRRIKIVGVDCRYVEILPEVERLRGTELELRATPAANPNYFFAGYQQKGDRYNIPNPTPDLHLRAWRAVAEAVATLDLSVVNCNPDSALDCFPITSWEAALAEDARHLAAAPAAPGSAAQAGAGAAGAQGLAGLVGGPPGQPRTAIEICVPADGGPPPAFAGEEGWTVHRFAPDPANPDTLAAGAMPAPPPEPPASAAAADITAMARLVGAQGLRRIDLLRTGSEPFGLAALRALRWGGLRPEAVHGVFTPGPAGPSGGWADIAAFLASGGYALYLAEADATAAARPRLRPYPTEAPPPPGSLLAFRDDPGLAAIAAALWPAPQAQAAAEAARPPPAGGQPPPMPAAATARPPVGADALPPDSLGDLTLDWRVLPGAPLQTGPQVEVVATDRGTAIETRGTLHIFGHRAAIALRAGGEVRVRHVGRLVRPHGNSAARSAFLVIARLFDAQGKLLGPHVIAVQPSRPTWSEGRWVVAMDDILRKHPAATRLRISISHNWVDDKAVGNAGDGACQTLLLEAVEAGAPPA